MPDEEFPFNSTSQRKYLPILSNVVSFGLAWSPVCLCNGELHTVFHVHGYYPLFLQETASIWQERLRDGLFPYKNHLFITWLLQVCRTVIRWLIIMCEIVTSKWNQTDIHSFIPNFFLVGMIKLPFFLWRAFKLVSVWHYWCLIEFSYTF